MSLTEKLKVLKEQRLSDIANNVTIKNQLEEIIEKIEPEVAQILGNLHDKFEIKVLVKDTRSSSSNKFMELFSDEV